MTSTFRSIHLAKRPETTIIAGETFTVETHPSFSLDSLKDGEVSVKVLYLSLDPAMRGWLDDRPSYVPPVAIGEVMRGYAIAKVVASKSIKFPSGTYVTGMTGWTEEAKMTEDQLEALPSTDPASAIRLTDYLGPLGITGLTAYIGMNELAKVRAEDIVVVSGAAGATGSIAGQIAKIQGATVYGIAGSDTKCKWLTDELGFDGALNYKSSSFGEDFKQLLEGKIDVFYDNVGGEVLELALLCARNHARFIMCGGISQFNVSEARGLANYQMLWRRRIRMEGFIVSDHFDKAAEARALLGGWISSGMLKRKETLVHGGLLQAEDALIQLFNGMNTGKLLVQVQDDTS